MLFPQEHVEKNVNGNIININNDLTNKKGFFIPKDKSHIRFMALSDTHLSSKWDNVDLLKSILKFAKMYLCSLLPEVDSALIRLPY